MNAFRIAGIKGPELTALERIRLYGRTISEVILFRRNIHHRRQLVSLIRTLHSYDITVGIDHEGGRVHRFPQEFAGITHFPAASIWMTNQARIVRQTAAQMAEELRSLGFDHWYAPVADRFHIHAGTDVIGDRSPSADTGAVAAAVVAMLEGSQGYGLTRCIKHFPGHGHLRVDSHTGLPASHRTLERWQEVDLPPFVAGVQAGAERVMVAHLSWPGAGMGRSWQDPALLALLRQTLGNKVVVLTDDLAMGAVRSTYPWALQPHLESLGFQGIMWCSAEATSRTQCTNPLR